MMNNRYLIAGVVASVALNLLLIGVLTGRASNMDTGMRRVDPMLGLRHLVGELPADRREALSPYFRAYFASLRPQFREIRGAQASLREAMLSDPVDEAALRSALVEFNGQLFNTQANAHDALITLASALTLVERRALVAILERPPKRRGERPPREHRRPMHTPPEARPGEPPS